MPDFRVWHDEEELLQFNVFVAELELIVGNSKDKRPDNVALLELLQKLVASINNTDQAVLKGSQKRCETAMVGVLTKGACAQVGCGFSKAGETLLAHARSVLCCWQEGVCVREFRHWHLPPCICVGMPTGVGVSWVLFIISSEMIFLWQCS